ncbi:MAG: PQQ-binding-like beta-propeller repeat protein [Fibrobacterota bacterium]
MKTRSLCKAAALALCFLSWNSIAEDWPTFKHDEYRTGTSSETVQLPLSLQWVYILQHPLAPAWGKGGRYSGKRPIGLSELPALNQFDWAAQLIVANGKVYFGSSSDDKLYCLDAATGHETWTFYTEGPIRLAPMAVSGRLLFGSDDGTAYCVNALDGALIWKNNPRPNAPWIAGNERLISSEPIRTDILAINGKVYFCTGLFPSNVGVNRISVNLTDGTLANISENWHSYQGYQFRKTGSDSLWCATGQGNDQYAQRLLAKGATNIESVFDSITVTSVVFRATNGHITASPGAWSATTKGKARSLAFADGRLYASTDSGYLYCFAATPVSPDTIRPSSPRPYPFTDPAEESAYRSAAAAIATASPYKKGYALVLESNGGKLAYALACTTGMKIICVENDSATAEQTRRNLDSAGMYGRVSVMYRNNGSSLPFSRFLFNLVVYDGFVNGLSFNGDRDEALELVQPCGGMAYLEPGEGLRKGSIRSSGEWSHHLCRPDNNPNSYDSIVSTNNLRLQWFGKPGPEHMPDREAKAHSPLWKNGIFLIPGEEYLCALDGYNGALLWEKTVPQFLRLPGRRHSGYLVLEDDYLYAASGKQCLAMVPQTGEQQMAFSLPSTVDNASMVWGFVGVLNDMLYGGAIRSRGVERIASLMTSVYGSWDNAPHAVEEALFAYDRHQSQSDPIWVYRPDSGRILSTTITLAQNRVYFLESMNKTLVSIDTSLFTLANLLSNGATALVALDALTGTPVWRDTLDLSKVTNSVAMIFAQGKLIITGSYNAYNSLDNMTNLQPQIDFTAIDGETGTVCWKSSQPTLWGAGDNHGQQDFRTYVFKNTVYGRFNTRFDLLTGDTLGNGDRLYGRNCTNMSASANAQFPTHFFGAWNIVKYGCSINFIPAGGLLSVSEASSGCTCPYSMQTSYGMLTTETNLTTSLENVAMELTIKQKLLITAFPNPFNPNVSFRYTLSRQKEGIPYSLTIFDCRGSKVMTLASGKIGTQDAGERHVVWTGIDHNGRKISSGMYYFRFVCGNRSRSGSLAFIK